MVPFREKSPTHFGSLWETREQKILVAAVAKSALTARIAMDKMGALSTTVLQKVNLSPKGV